ncbi:Dnaj homolog subfamily b member 12 [Phtheirospermum japonicum]|uniref:Dnaj homolog subfamily b member 12 n=1 Tax=Phtheirospermum japonicum TaxID=374723 RepID=A0A830BKB8_9LAMI|nr:Dnaj homolog subfamily b member 12 [Phtheirospermum japonicum]
MECNKDEAMRAKVIAEKKMENNDFVGARKIALRARNLYPELENITQLLCICDVHCSAQNGLLGSEKDFYEVLQVEKFADELTIKKQYRRLALILHPDKNRFPGAESAFKLICEANAMLSDSTRKSLYDSKIRVSTRSAPVNPPNHVTKSSKPNKPHSARNNISNGYNSMSQQQATQSTPSISQEAFWTACPFCTTRYQYLREFIRKSLCCPTCRKIFVAYEASVHGNTSKTKAGQNMPPKPDSSQPAAFREKGVPNRGNKKTGIQNDKGTQTSQAGSHQGMTGKKTVKPEQDGATKAKEVENLKRTQETDNKNTNSLHRENKGGILNGDATNRETGDPRSKSRKRDRKESSESFDTSSDSDVEELTMEGKFGDFPRRSSRKRQHVSYQEEDNVKDQKDALDSEDAENSVLGTKEAETVEPDEETGGKLSNGADTVEIESDSDQDMFSSEDKDIDCPDPEFSDFERARDESEFDVNQFWACYDTLDDMPRFYAKVKKVFSSPFELSITWLEPVPLDEAYETWVDEELPVGCGSFKLGKTEKTDLRLSFSHRVHFEKGKKRGSLLMYPREGEVWALFKDWDVSWSCEPDNHKEKFKYEIVEVLSDFVAGSGIRVVYLDKVNGFVSLFQRGDARPFVVGPSEVYKFSHCVPCFKMTGSEREGVPIGSFELDPASIPLNPDDVYYPGKKAKMEDRKMGPGVNCPSVSNPANKKKGKDVVSDCVGTTSPEKFVDLEETKGEKFEMRRSPRGQNVIRRNAV